MATPFRKRVAFRVIKPKLEAKKRVIFKKALRQSFLVLTGLIAWVALFGINNQGVLGEFIGSIYSLPGIFFPFLAVLMAILSYLFLRGKTEDEILVVSALVLISGLAEAWGLNKNPSFLVPMTITSYLLTKIWIKYLERMDQLENKARL